MTRPTVPTERLVARLDELGFGLEEPNTTAEITDFDRTLDLEAAADGLDLETIIYDPDRFPGLIYRPEDTAAVAVLFDDGTLFIESAEPSSELIADLKIGLIRLGLVGGAANQVRNGIDVSPSEVPVPPEFVDESGTQTSVYPDEGSATGGPPTGSDSDTRIYQSDDVDSPAEGTSQSSDTESGSGSEYVDLDADAGTSSQAPRIHVATISEKRDVLEIIDAVHDGDIVIAEIPRHTVTDSTMEHIIDDLRQVADEVDGDIVQKGDDQLIITPTGVTVGREKLS